MTATCATCRFFRSSAEYDRPADGNCRRFPPTLMPVHEGIYENRESGHGIEWRSRSGWPQVDKDDWCGEYRSREGDQ